MPTSELAEHGSTPTRVRRGPFREQPLGWFVVSAVWAPSLAWLFAVGFGAVAGAMDTAGEGVGSMVVGALEGAIVGAFFGTIIVMPFVGGVCAVLAAPIAASIDWISGYRLPRRLVAALAIVMVALVLAVTSAAMSSPGPAHEKWMMRFIGAPTLFALASLVVPLPPRPLRAIALPWPRDPRGWVVDWALRLPCLAALLSVLDLLVGSLRSFIDGRSLAFGSGAPTIHEALARVVISAVQRAVVVGLWATLVFIVSVSLAMWLGTVIARRR